jgi:hypothetical protein
MQKKFRKYCCFQRWHGLSPALERPLFLKNCQSMISIQKISMTCTSRLRRLQAIFGRYPDSGAKSSAGWNVEQSGFANTRFMAAYGGFRPLSCGTARVGMGDTQGGSKSGYAPSGYIFTSVGITLREWTARSTDMRIQHVARGDQHPVRASGDKKFSCPRVSFPWSAGLSVSRMPRID